MNNSYKILSLEELENRLYKHLRVSIWLEDGSGITAPHLTRKSVKRTAKILKGLICTK